MGKATTLAVVLLAACGVRPSASAETIFENWSEETATVTSAVRVATYNIRQSNCDRDTPNAWEERKADLVALIRNLDLDVFGLQEVNPDQAAYLRETLSEFALTGDHRNKDRVSGEASPVLYRKDRFEALGGGTFWLSETPDVPGSKGWDAANPRICSWLRLRDRGTRGVFCFANVHTDNKGETARREGLALVLRRMCESNPSETPVVLVGDFNCRENEEPILAVAEKMTNALYASETPPSGPWRTGNGWHWNDRERLIAEALALDAGTRNAKIKHTGRFDYIFVSRGVRVESFETVGTPRPGMQTYPSDHFPVVADLVVLAARLRPPSAAVVFENWSEETATVNIAEDGRKGWIKALPANGEKKAKLVVPTGFNHAPTHAKASEPLSCVFALDELPAGEVRFAVTPINCWGRRGTPLVSEWAGHIAAEMLDASAQA